MKKYIPLLALSFLIAACNDQKEQDNPTQKQQIPQAPTTKVETRTITTFDTYPATVEGIVNSDVRTKITGYITHVMVDEGQRVSKGQSLFKIETQSRTEDAQAAQANINAAQVRVDQLLPLVEQNIVSQSQLETAKAQLAQAKAAYQSIQADIAYSNITSPVNGFVGEVRLRQGNLVSPADPMPLTTVSEINQVYVYFAMNESQYLDFIKEVPGKTIKEKIQKLPKLSFIMANGDTYPHQGTVQTINSQVDKMSGTISFRAMFDNPEHILTNGSTGSIQIPHLHSDVVVVPQQSTFESQDKIIVMKVEKSDGGAIAHAQAIAVADRIQGLYIVKSGVQAGDEIVVKGVNKIPDGSAIAPVLMPFDSAAQVFISVFEK